MRRLRLIAVFVLAGSFALANPTSLLAEKNEKDKSSANAVVVINTAASPVPVSGSVNAAVTGTVNTNVTNTVPVTGTVNANVTNVVNANVTNTVPVTGTVNANVTGTVPVTGTVAVSTMPSVSISSLPAIALGTGATVAVDSTTPVNVVNVSARNVVHAFSWVAGLGTSGGIALGYPNPAYTVPAGKRLVINNVSVRLTLPTGASLGELDLGAGGFMQFMELHKTASTPSGDVYVYNSGGTVYADQNQGVGVQWNDMPSGSTTLMIFVQGYLVDCGAGCF